VKHEMQNEHTHDEGAREDQKSGPEGMPDGAGKNQGWRERADGRQPLRNRRPGVALPFASLALDPAVSLPRGDGARASLGAAVTSIARIERQHSRPGPPKFVR